MIIEINETKEIQKRLRLEGKVEVLDKPKNIQSIIEMNQLMEEVHRDYIYKAAMSEIRARDFWVYQN